MSKDVLVGLLEADELVLVDRVDLTPRRARDLDGKPPANRRGTVHLAVDVPPGEDAVVLLERDGVYSWHLPTNQLDRARTRDLDPPARTATFAIAVQPSPPARGPVAPSSGSPGRGDRGLLGDLIRGAAQAIVFRFVAPVVLGKVVDVLERTTRTGLVHVTGTAVEQWLPIDSVSDLRLPTDRPARILLLVHGTFSSTVGGFGALALGVAGQVFLDNALHSYDAVVGYDHRTLSLDPRANAADLLERLEQHRSEHALTIDVITHSRGGLTTRSFVEELLPQSDWNAIVDKIVFVAATNAGTHLADPDRWHDLIDLYTNLGSVIARGLALIPGAAPIVAVVGGVLRGIASFVKYLVSTAAKGDEVPGLAAMVPGGPFVTEINELQPGQPGPGTNWFVVSSNFHVSLVDDSHHPPEFPRELAVKLAEGLLDRIFEDDNDLVVDTDSMSAIGLPAGGFVADTLSFGTNDVVYHVNYFAQDRLVDRVSLWLGQGLGAGDRDLPMSVPPEPTGAEPPPEEEAPADGEVPPEEEAPADGEVPPDEEAPPDGEAPPEAETTGAVLAAEMPGLVVPDTEFIVRVRLSRRAVVPSSGAVHAEEDVQVAADRPVSVQVVGKRNATLIDREPDVFMLPVGGGTSELTFRARALGTGPVVLTVVVRQGRVPIATLSLEAGAVARVAAGVLRGSSPLSVATTHTGIDAPELDGLPCLDVVARDLGDGRVVYQYAVRIEKDSPARIFESLPMTGPDDKVRQALRRVNDTVRATSDSPAEQLAAMQDIGSTLFRQFFPTEMQEHLWAHRDEIIDLIVYSDEPYVPWELIHLRPPTGRRQKAPRFLAQGGLVRWRLGSFPPRELAVRGGRARSLCPAYVDPLISNDAGLREQVFLAERFGATAVTATPAQVRNLLRTGGYDLLHFSGHGAADPDDILGAKVLLKGRLRGRTVQQEYLAAVTVSENARPGDPGSPGPVIVLNACQTGRSGELFTTVGGFATAFLDAGASAFVSSLWSVHEEPAGVFVETLYDELLSGAPMAEASARARAAARESGDPTWLAYVVYARPDAVLTRPDEPSTTPAPHQ